MMNTTDAAYMAEAIALAKPGRYFTMPNPTVGCLLVKDGRVIGRGATAPAGGPHGEIQALNNASESVEGATAYVSLEPCCHHGKTPPCTEALIAAKVARVVFAMEDPNPKVAGAGAQQLREAGIQVDGPLLENEARALNPGFIHRMEHGRPFVRVKSAMSLDGRTAMASGQSHWITGQDARADVQRLRAESCAIVTGIGTVLHDDPQLNVRPETLPMPIAAAVGERQPLRVIVDSKAQLQANARILHGGGTVQVVAEASAEPVTEQWVLPGEDGNVDLRALLVKLAERQCNQVLIEAGATLAGEFVKRALVDELIVYMAPK